MPPPSKFQKAAHGNLVKVKAALDEENAEPPSESLVSQSLVSDSLVSELKEKFDEALEKNGYLESQLAEKENLCSILRDQLNKSQAQCHKLQSLLLAGQLKHENVYHELCMLCQKTKQGIVKQETLEKQIELLKSADKIKADQLKNDSWNSEKAINSLLKANEVNYPILWQIGLKNLPI